MFGLYEISMGTKHGAFTHFIVHKLNAIKILTGFYDALRENGTLIIKDVTATPRWRMWFTWLLDKLMDSHTFLHYYTRDEMVALLENQGFEVKFRYIPDILPYPHILYICQKRITSRDKDDIE